MPRPQIFRWSVTGKTPLYVQAEMVDRKGVLLLQAGVTTIELRVYEGETQVCETQTFLPASTNGTIYDTLQTSNGWSALDGVGYNFDYTFASDLFERIGGKVYLAEFTFNTASTLTGPVYLRGWIDVESVLSEVA